MTDVISVGAIIIGNEILSGRTQEANITFIGKHMDDLGIIFKEARIIPDEEDIIIATVNELRKKYTYVLTTGGIGPTHDDITSFSIAKAFGIRLNRDPEAVLRMEEYYQSGEINEARLKMADIPLGARLIDNPISGAPGFQLENVFVMAGVPVILQAMLTGINDRLVGGNPILTAWIATNLRESVLAKGLSELQDRFNDVSIGSYPFFKNRKSGVNVVMRSTDKNQLKETSADLEKLVRELGGKILEIHSV